MGYVESTDKSEFTVPVLNKDTNTIEEVTYEDSSSIHPGKYLMGLMLNRIIDLLITMIKTMQGVAVQQAQKMSFFTKMQNANTDLMNSVHTFTLNNTDPAYISQKGDDENLFRQALNQTNTTYIEQIKADNNLVANTAKQIQTNVNQTQDAVNQQSNMLSSLIQQLRSINSSISRGG